MRNLLFLMTSILLFSAVPVIADGHGKTKMDDQSYQAFKQQGPFNHMYPKTFATQSADHFDTVNGLFSGSVLPTKYAELAGISASAAVKCQYCVIHHTAMAKKAGASEEEIKTAIMIAAEMARMSTLLYGNQFPIEQLEKMYQGN